MKGYNREMFNVLRSVLSETKRSSDKVKALETQENIDAFNFSLAKLMDFIGRYDRDIIHPPSSDEDFGLYTRKNDPPDPSLFLP